jgi:hypothetical protein
MDASEFGSVIDDKDEHPLKHPIPMDVTDIGIVMDDKDEHP